MPDGQEIPDIQADQIGVFATEWGVMLVLNAIMPPERIEDSQLGGPPTQMSLPTQMRGIVRISHAHAKTVAMILKRTLKQYESVAGEIPLPPGVQQRHNFSPDEWD